MTRYSNEPKNQIIVKCYEFLSFAKNMSKIVFKNTRKSLNTVQECWLRVKIFLIMLNNLLQIYLKLLQKEKFKKEEKW